MAKYPTLSPAAIEKLCSLIRESHSVSEGINDENIGINSTFSSLKIQEDMKKLENNTESKIIQAIQDALGSYKEADNAIDSWF